MTTPVQLIKRPVNPSHVQRLQNSGVSPLMAKLFAARGVTSPSEAVPGYAYLLPGASMKNVEKMASYLADCQVQKKRVLIISDYDCDGATACAVLMLAFGASGMNFDYLVPDRVKHGYGLTPAIVEEAAALEIRPDVIITVDNGISSTYGVDRANELGIEVLITDHHLAPEVLPNARLIVNPNQAGCEFHSKDIAGCGVAWYVARAYAEELEARDIDPGYGPAELLSYVAIGTVADVVKLDKNNRIMIREGLQLIREGYCAPGVLALIRVSGKDHKTLSCSDIGFGVGPRINAAGRLEHMRAGVECLTTVNELTANELAKRLDATNEERKDIQMDIVDEAVIQATEAMGDGSEDRFSIVAYHPDWHEGVVGIVAGRLKEDRHRPTIVMCEASDGDIKGSGRSIPGFHLKHALDTINVRHPGILKKFGGHAMAAGMTIDKTRFEEFKLAVETVCKEGLTPDLLVKTLKHDGEICRDEFTVDEISAMALEVWGQGFEEPVFVNEVQVNEITLMGELKNHLRIKGALRDQEATIVGFGLGHLAECVPENIVIAFKPQVNTFRGEQTLQMLIEDVPYSMNPGLEEVVAEISAKKAEVTTLPAELKKQKKIVLKPVSQSVSAAADSAQVSAPASAPAPAPGTGTEEAGLAAAEAIESIMAPLIAAVSPVVRAKPAIDNVAAAAPPVPVDASAAASPRAGLESADLVGTAAAAGADPAAERTAALKDALVKGVIPIALFQPPLNQVAIPPKAEPVALAAAPAAPSTAAAPATSAPIPSPAGLQPPPGGYSARFRTRSAARP